MDFPFKRLLLIAIIVIAALGVIFVPVWEKNYRANTLQSFTIPSSPALPSAALLHSASNKPSVKSLLNFPLTPAKAWVVELPDIKDPKVAENLVQTLRRKGFNAYSHEYKSLLGVLTRVFVGPEINPKQMEQVAKKLNTEMHLVTQVIPFDPLLYP